MSDFYCKAAYRGPYKTPDEAKSDWDSGRDFYLISGPGWGGVYFSKRNVKEGNVWIHIPHNFEYWTKLNG